jgi:hypothetical protein
MPREPTRNYLEIYANLLEAHTKSEKVPSKAKINFTRQIPQTA